MSERSNSKSPKRGRSSRTSGGAKSAASKASTKKSSASDSTGARSKSPPKSRMSSAKSEGLMSAGKPSTITSRRVRVQSAGLESRGLRTLDMSGQGMTALGGTLFSRRDVGDLDLSSNNLRIIPPDIRKLTTIVHIDLSRNGIRCTHSQDFTGLPRELSQLPHLEVLIISECNLPFIPPAIWMCRNLKVLDVSRNKINLLVPDIGNLEKLQHLNAQQTSIMTLPPEIALCQDLEEVMLWGNVIESLPETLKELPKLKVLAINFRSFCNMVDSYREGLLKKGQIQSEHIPPVLFEMPALDGLDLNETKLNNLPEECVGKLTEFFIAKNFFNKMPSVVLNMESLEILDISDNMIKHIPDEIGRLVNLTSLKLDNNKINVFPTTLGKLKRLTSLMMGGNQIYSIPNEIGELTSLKMIVLDRNQIRNVPETIINLEDLETLDLTNNKIKTLPLNFYKMKKITSAHTYQKFHKHGLWLHQNPLVTPPEEVWKTENPEQIFKFLRRLEIQRTKNLQRQKLYLLGAPQCGKTSLAKAVMTGKSALTEGLTESTAMIDFFAWTTDNGVSFRIHDFGGAEVYRNIHHMFLDPKGIYLIVYDLSTFTKDNFHEVIGYWMDMLRLYVPGAIVKIIGTKTDKCDPETVESSEEEVQQLVREHLVQRLRKLEATAALLDKSLKQTEITPQEQEHLKQQKFKVMALRKQLLRMQPMSLVSSADGITGILNLVNDLELIAIDKTLCPHAQKVIPETWFQFRLALKSRKDKCLSLSEVKKIAKSQKFPRDQIADCLHFLVDCGEILWLQKIPELQNVIFQRPQYLVDILKGCFRHDMDTFLDFENNRIFTCKGQMTKDQFEKAKYMLQTAGQVSRSLLQCLWFYLMLSPDDFEATLELVSHLNLVYAIPQPDVPKPRSEFVALMVVPSFNEERLLPAEDLQECWPYPLPPGQSELTISSSFPLNHPSGLFQVIACRLQDLVNFRVDWKDATYAEMDVGTILLQKREDSKSGDCTIDVKARGVDVKSTKFIISEVSYQLQICLESYTGLVWTGRLTADNCGQTHLKDCFSTNIFTAL